MPTDYTDFTDKSKSDLVTIRTEPKKSALFIRVICGHFDGFSHTLQFMMKRSGLIQYAPSVLT